MTSFDIQLADGRTLTVDAKPYRPNLLIGTSAQLPGLFVTGLDLDDLREEALAVAEELIVHGARLKAA
jgi:hypothetical protein